jgi:thiol:disulfide interchange protein DsbD
MTDFFQLTDRSFFLAVAISFAGGLMTSLTPCVYPVILITVAVFGAREARSRLQAFLLSATFASAIIIMYTTLGIVSSLTGTIFGRIYQSKGVLIAIALLFTLMALSLFGLFTLQLPESLRSRFASAGKAGFGGAFVMGLVSGLLAAPCTGPVLVGILTFVSATRSLLVGGALLFAYALGLTLIFIVVGTFVMSLPKSGKWLDAVKDILGAVMLILAFHFIRPVLPVPRALQELLPAALPAGIAAAASGLILIAAGHALIYRMLMGRDESHATTGKRAVFQMIRIAAIVLLVSGACAAILAVRGRPAASGVTWILDDEERAQQLHVEKKMPMIIDFTALWCEACGDIDRKTFSDETVSKEMQRFVRLRMDLTDVDEKADRARKKYAVGGLPTVIVIDSKGRETARITKFIGAPDLLKILRNVR